MTESVLSGAIGEQLRPTRRQIILTLKQHGGLTAAELAELLGITSMGVRRHLATLEQERLVRHELVQRGKGRPSYVYRLGAKAENLFPKNYAALTNELLGYLAARQSESAVIDLFDQRALRRIRQAQARLAGCSLRERVATLAELLTEEGYLAEWEQVDEDTFRLREHNCAVREVAAEYRAACRSELTFLQAVLTDAEVTHQQHIIAGDRACAYTIHRRNGAP